MAATFLLARLYGPLCAWGGPAVGELRPTGETPTRSALLGLVGACLGVKRDDAEGQAALASGYGIAVRVDAAGRRLEDYHTVQAPKARKGFAPVSRRAELLDVDGDDIETMVTRRGYLMDAVYSVAWWQRPGARWSLAEIAEAMRRPVFVPYLGRKSCPLGLPLAPLASPAADLGAALTELDAAVPDPDPLAALIEAGPRLLVWDLDPPGGDPVSPQRVSLRRDAPVDRTRWQFVERQENAAQWEPAP